jgi:hypothetical protein
LPAAGTVQLVSATPIERALALTRLASAVSGSSAMPFSAAAPAIFSTTSVPATPRRPVVQVESSTATSSLVMTLATWPPDISAPISKFITSPS